MVPEIDDNRFNLGASMTNSLEIDIRQFSNNVGRSEENQMPQSTDCLPQIVGPNGIFIVVRIGNVQVFEQGQLMNEGTNLTGCDLFCALDFQCREFGKG